MNQSEKDEKHKVAQRCVDTLREHFDAVQIMVSCPNQGDTWSIKKGAGDFYARIGMAREFLIEDEQRSRIAINRESNPPDDGPESWQFL